MSELICRRISGYEHADGMQERTRKSGRSQVRVENVSGAWGNVDHMTIDELKARPAACFI